MVSPLGLETLVIGAMASDFAMEHMLLQLQRSPEQEVAVQQFLEELTTQGSPNFHQWLTAQEFGERFGLAKPDLDAVTGWLVRLWAARGALLAAGNDTVARSMSSRDRDEVAPGMCSAGRSPLGRMGRSVFNQPGYMRPSQPDQYGLYIDVPRDPKYDFDSKIDLYTYGRSSGIMGLRIFPNPNFNDAAKKKWNACRDADLFHFEPAGNVGERGARRGVGIELGLVSDDQMLSRADRSGGGQHRETKLAIAVAE